MFKYYENVLYIEKDVYSKRSNMMPDWLVTLIVGIATAVLGFIGGFFTKTYQVKIRQKAKGKNINQNISGVNNG